MCVPVPEPRPHRPRWVRATQRLLGAIAALLVLAVAATAVVIRLPLPPRSGRERLPGLSAQVTVTFDPRGVPHVRASTEDDACRALGWLHAGDLFGQMELRRRAATGTLAEILGPSLLSFDLRSRREPHRRAAGGGRPRPSPPPGAKGQA